MTQQLSPCLLTLQRARVGGEVDRDFAIVDKFSDIPMARRRDCITDLQ